MKSGNRDKAEGTMKDVKGEIKESVGRHAGDRDLEREGHKNQAEGKGQKAVGEVKKAFNK